MTSYPYTWQLADLQPPKPDAPTVFGTFICGGGSTMGYKLAGFNHLGGVEIDGRLAETYNTNHHPQHLYIEDLRAFNQRETYPEPLTRLDLLDGSPPCSTFSECGNREKDWGKQRKFTEGQANQTLDDLFFTYLETAEKLRPKIVLAENVKGLIIGNAKAYLAEILQHLKRIGYTPQVWLLNAALMGVPQARRRVFIIARQTSLNWKPLKLDFNEPPIPFRQIIRKGEGQPPPPSIKALIPYWQPGDLDFACACQRKTGRDSFFNHAIVRPNRVCPTLTARPSIHKEGDDFRQLSLAEQIAVSTFPTDYNFGGVEPRYLVGMSVPPVMTARIAHEIRHQWLQ